MCTDYEPLAGEIMLAVQHSRRAIAFTRITERSRRSFRLEMYIEPTLHIHSTLAEAKEFLSTYGPYHFWSEKTPVGISDVAQGKRNLIIGEPGVGKTMLMSTLQEYS
jgi:hypothetical protein